MLAARIGMAKRCGFCAFESEDEGAFRAHLADAHGWGRAARGVTVDREKVGREYVLERIVDLVRSGVLDLANATRLRQRMLQELGRERGFGGVAATGELAEAVEALPAVSAEAV